LVSRSRAGLPYRSAHKLRHGHAFYGLLHAGTMADYKALSENMLHADIRTTDDTYAMLSSEEVRKRIAGLFSKHDMRERPSTDLENIPNEQMFEVLMGVAKRLAKYIGAVKRSLGYVHDHFHGVIGLCRSSENRIQPEERREF
jgi:hypothetical protein